MNWDKKKSRTLSILSWVVLVASLLTGGFLVAGIIWVWSRSVLTTETLVPGYQGLSLASRYLQILTEGFLNVTWVLAFAGVLFVWFWARGRGAPAKRIALAISLVFIHRWLELTLVFLFLFSKLKI